MMGLGQAAMLLWGFFQIGLFSFGGGYAAIPLIQEQVIDIHHWLTMQEFTDIITISQMTPGPLAVNTSTFVGLRLAGVAGAVAATFGCVVSGCVISIVLYRFFVKYRSLRGIGGVLHGLKAVSAGLIGGAAMTILMIALKGDGTMALDVNIRALLIFGAALFLSAKLKLNPMIVMVLSGVAGVFCY